MAYLSKCDLAQEYLKPLMVYTFILKDIADMTGNDRSGPIIEN